MNTTPFELMDAARPDRSSLETSYATIVEGLRAATSADEQLAYVRQWDALRRTCDTWSNLVYIRFHQDTRCEKARAEKDVSDEMAPFFAEHDSTIKRLLLESPCRDELESALGATAFLKWRSDVAAFDPKMSAGMVAEAKAASRYVALLASAQIPFEGETFNLSGLRKFSGVADRAVRHGSQRAAFAFFEEHGEAFDGIYDELVKTRHQMATDVGMKDYVELGYLRMARMDYDRSDVETFRDGVRAHIVPMVSELRRRQAQALEIDRVMAWDEGCLDPNGNPKPLGDDAWMCDRAQEMFDAMDSDLGAFFRLMRERNLLDLTTRDGKAGGGFCTTIADYEVPFIYANFNGTKDDVVVFTHEAGHAYQAYKSRDLFPFDYAWPTYEACEIHSMSLEFLTWPHMHRFFGEEGSERFRRAHLTQALMFMPYGVAVDHFQHDVYENPNATPAERHEMWKRVEELYLPWRDYGDLAFGAKGGAWQQQRHIYEMPFYYIDYVLAQTCALQFWVRSEQDAERALEDYKALCLRGGSQPFRALARSAQLRSPFDPDSLQEVTSRAREVLGL